MEINSLLMPLLAPRDYPGVHGPRGKSWDWLGTEPQLPIEPQGSLAPPRDAS
jgi:hypothetical protein